jgi:hypothetical protein
MYKNIAATLQIVERARRGRSDVATTETNAARSANPDANEACPAKLGPMQKVVAFGPLV